MAARAPIKYRAEVRIGIDYARRVVAGKIAAGRWVLLACQRFLADLEKAEAGKGRWAFNQEFAVRPILLGKRLPNIKGPEAGQLLRLMPFQHWLIINIYGFIERATGNRRFQQASIWMPRGNAKSTLVAVLGLATTFLEGEGGAEGYAAAVSHEQARIVFDFAQAMTRRTPGLREEFGIGVREHSIYQLTTGSRFQPVAADAKTLEGLNVHFVSLDEIGSHKTKAVYDVMMTAMVKRTQPLALMISTATDNVTGIGKDRWDYGEKILLGQLEDDRYFAVMYAADVGDDPWAEATWEKANPGYGQMVQPEQLRTIARQARASPALQAAFMTRHLNIWVGADQALFNLGYWDRCANPGLTLAEFRGQPCFAAIDMAVRVDLAAASLVFPFADDGDGPSVVRYAIFHKAWLPEMAVDANRNPAYVDWAERGFIEVTEGETTSFEAIEQWLRGVGQQFDLRACAYDPYALMQLSQRLENDGYPMYEFRSTTLNFSEPTKLLDALMRDGHLEHDGSPVARWCIGNVAGHYDRRGNVYPTKPRAETKIDCAIADIMAIGASFAADLKEQYIYADGRELLVL
jgi:phage terminase large subunit-like protein